MHTVVPAWLAIILSTVVVVVIGEIIPQALCTGPNQMQIAVAAIPFVNVKYYNFSV